MVYINDIAESLTSLTRLFADDTSLSVSNRAVQHIEHIINKDLQIISYWSKQWLVDFNPSKTETMFFSLNHNDTLPNIVFDGTVVNFVDVHKHLGVSLSADGSWHEHISNIVKSASKIINTMRLLKFKLTRDSLNQIYISYLRPILEYASPVWDNCS